MTRLPFIIAAAVALGVVLCTAAHADAPGPADTFADLICDPITNAPIRLAPQFGPKAPPLAIATPPARASSMDHPPHGTGGSGGHEPDYPPATVPVPPSAYLTIGALLALACVARAKKDA